MEPNTSNVLGELTESVGRLANGIDGFRGELDQVREHVGLDVVRRSGYRPEDTEDGRPVNGRERPTLLRAKDRFTDWYRRTHGAEKLPAAGEFSLGRMVYTMVTGDRGPLSDLEKRSLSEGIDANGGFLTPEPLAAEVIDNIRNKTRVIDAGARVVPMTSDSLAIPRITGPSTPAWRAELAAVTASQQTFDRVTFKPKTAATLVRLSMELFEDLTQEGFAAIQQEITAALALTLDLGALRGTGSASDPKGIRNQTNVQLLSMGANGAALTSYDTLSDAIGMVWDQNGEPNAAIMSSRSGRELAKLKDTTNQPLQPPAPVAALNRLVSNQIPNNLTQGTSTDCSEVYVGDFAECLIGLRSQIGLRILQERFADTMEIGLLAYLRADVQLAHPEHFVVVTGVR